MKNKIALCLLFAGITVYTNAQQKAWKPLGPFTIHKTVGPVSLEFKGEEVGDGSA